MRPSDIFMHSVYAAIADNAIPHIGGFGNGVDRRGSDYIEDTLRAYPVLQKYMDDPSLRVDAFRRYSAAIAPLAKQGQ